MTRRERDIRAVDLLGWRMLSYGYNQHLFLRPTGTLVHRSLCHLIAHGVDLISDSSAPVCPLCLWVLEQWIDQPGGAQFLAWLPDKTFATADEEARS